MNIGYIDKYSWKCLLGPVAKNIEVKNEIAKWTVNKITHVVSFRELCDIDFEYFSTLIPFNFHSYLVVSNTAATAITPAASSSMSNYVPTAFYVPVTVTAASAAAASSHTIFIKGVLEVGATAATNVNFTIGFTAAPTTSSILQGTYILIYPIPSVTATNTSVGSWV